MGYWGASERIRNAEGLVQTPMRAEKALKYLTSGYSTDVDKIVNGALVRRPVRRDGDRQGHRVLQHVRTPYAAVLRKSACCLPSREKVIGLSKIPRIVDMFARRFQVQERLTQEIADTLNDVLKPRGVGVDAEARHFCMMMRGVEKQHSGTRHERDAGRVPRAERDPGRVSGAAAEDSFGL